MKSEIRNTEGLRTALAEARPKLEELRSQHPSEWVFDSILKQLAFIEALANGKTPDPGAKKDDLNLGFLGMRFVCDYDDELGRLLSAIERFAHTLA